MSRTKRRKNGYCYWVDKHNAEQVARYHSDAGTYDHDTCPPKWFRQAQHKKWRKKENQRLNSCASPEDEVFDDDFKMPYYT